MLRDRGEPRLSDAVGASGGLVVAIGVLLISLDVFAEGAGRPPGFALFLALTVAGYVMLSWLPAAVHPAAVAMIAAGVIGAMGWWWLPRAGEFDDVRPFLVLTIAALVICWAAPLTRGRPLFVGLALALAWLWLIGEVAGNDAYSAAPVPSPPAHTLFSFAAFSGRAAVTLDELDGSDPLYPLAQDCADGDLDACDTLYRDAPIGSDFEEFGSSCGDTFAGPPGNCATGFFGPDDEDVNPFVPEPFVPIDEGGVDDDWLGIGLVSLFLGLVYLAGLYAIDQAGNPRLATAFVVPAGVALFTGTQALGNAAEQAWLGGALTFAAGLVFGFVGHAGRRRFTAWAGGLMAGVGAITVAFDIADVSDTTSGEPQLVGPGLLVIAFGAGLVALAYAVAQWFQAREEPPAVPTPPLPPEPPAPPSGFLPPPA
jgi:hypothetical protein